MLVHGGRSGDDVRAGALERGGPRRGGVEPSSEADLARGGVEPSSEAGRARGGVEISSEADPARGAFNPRARWTSPEGASAVLPRQAAGATRVVIVSCACFRFVS
jgi:hypothetical protein